MFGRSGNAFHVVLIGTSIRMVRLVWSFQTHSGTNPNGVSLIDFLNGLLRAYFATQSLIDLGIPDAWPSGEWKHGTNGIIDFYAEVLETQKPQEIYQYLRIVKSEVIKAHWPCPCGSGKKLRQCNHLPIIEQLRSRIPRRLLAQSAELLFKYLLADNMYAPQKNQ